MIKSSVLGPGVIPKVRGLTPSVGAAGFRMPRSCRSQGVLHLSTRGLVGLAMPSTAQREDAGLGDGEQGPCRPGALGH